MEETLRSYRAPWEGELLLACKKCQRKLKRGGLSHSLGKLKKTIKGHNKLEPSQRFELVNVGCMDLCPKGAVAICLPRNPNRLHILRDEQDLSRLP